MSGKILLRAYQTPVVCVGIFFIFQFIVCVVHLYTIYVCVTILISYYNLQMLIIFLIDGSLFICVFNRFHMFSLCCMKIQNRPFYC